MKCDHIFTICSFLSEKMSNKSVILQRKFLIFVRKNVIQICDFIKGNADFCLTNCQTNKLIYKGKCSFLSDKMSDKSLIL